MIEMPRCEVPTVNTNQMIEVDRAMMEDYHIELIQMMENAGRNLAHLARERFFDGNPTGKHVLVMAGSGGNGGGALVAARRLSNWGAKLTVALGQSPEKMAPVPAHQLDIVERMNITGTKASAKINELEKKSFDLIRHANASSSPILALDTPSGVDTTSGTVFNPAIKASATLTLALPKDGLLKDDVSKQTGELYLADISVPPDLYKSPSLSMNLGSLFAQGEIIRIV